MKKLIARYIRETEGQDLIEYALLASIIALAGVLAMTNLGTAINTQFQKVQTQLETANP